MKHIRTGWIIFLVVVITILPYGFAALAAGPEHYFNGILFNPLDGNSYLAKMYEGWRGDWTFTLPYTADIGSGSYLFIFYIALGHLARLTGLSLVLVFHAARITAAIFLGFSLSRYFSTIFTDRGQFSLAFGLASLGTGLGWLAILFGIFPSDSWVAEAYPILSVYANPHFPLSLAIILWALSISRQTITWVRALCLILAGLFLGLIQPFGVILVAVVLGGTATWEFLRRREIHWKAISAVLLGGIPILAYQFSLVRTDPFLANWNLQNQTPSPTVFDLLFSFSPALLLAVITLVLVIRKKITADTQLMVWMILGLVLIYLPFSLQRRFMLGLFIPLAGLAAQGLAALVNSGSAAFRRAAAAVIGLSLPTTVLILLIGVYAGLTHDSRIYLSRGEKEMLTWIQKNTPDQARILASPEMGMFVPAHTGRRVFYGHPYETVHASSEQAWVEDTLRKLSQNVGTHPAVGRQVDYVLWGPRERSLVGRATGLDLPIAYQSDDVTLYQISP